MKKELTTAERLKKVADGIDANKAKLKKQELLITDISTVLEFIINSLGDQIKDFKSFKLITGAVSHVTD